MKYSSREKPPTLFTLWLALVACTSAGRPGTSPRSEAGASGGTGPAVDAAVGSGGTGGTVGPGGAGGGPEELLDAQLDRTDMRPLSTVDAPPPPPSPPDVKVINDRGCMYLAAGPFTPVMGAPNFSYSAPPVMSSPPAFRVQIRGSAHLSFTPPAVGEYVFFTSAPISLVVFALDGNLLPVKALSTVIPECRQVAGRQAFDLTPVPYVIRLGPSTATTVDLAIVPR
jgi:hypothetical protein